MKHILSLADILANNELHEHKGFLEGPAGYLESIITSNKNNDYLAIVCHPHPLYQGTMHNKVVTSVAKAFHSQGITTIRFNYRGVGHSDGEYGNVIGEVSDLKAVIEQVLELKPNINICLAGFSFGAYIAASAASDVKFKQNITQLITIAPAVNKVDFSSLQQIYCPWLTVAAEKDEIVPMDELLEWYSNLDNNNKDLRVIKDSSHFFHGKLIDLMRTIPICK